MKLHLGSLGSYFVERQKCGIHIEVPGGDASRLKAPPNFRSTSAIALLKFLTAGLPGLQCITCRANRP
jgi:hypothetical protein